MTLTSTGEVERDHDIGAAGSECLGALQDCLQLHSEFETAWAVWRLLPPSQSAKSITAFQENVMTNLDLV